MILISMAVVEVEVMEDAGDVTGDGKEREEDAKVVQYFDDMYCFQCWHFENTCTTNRGATTRTTISIRQLKW